MSEVVVVSRFSPAPGALDAVLEALAVAVPQVHDEPGCLLYTVNVEDSGTIVMIEKWSSREALDSHDSADAVTGLRVAIDGLLVGDGLLSIAAAVPLGDARKGAL